MKKITFMLALILMACSTSKETVKAVTSETPPPVQPSYTAEQINEGKSLYEAKCVLCHDLEKPTSHTAAKWKHEVPEMVEMANKEKNAGITKAQEELILAYVLTYSKR